MWLELGTVLVLTCTLTTAQFPQNDYEHSVRRGWLKENERQSLVLPSLNADEQIVDHYLQYLKWKEFKATQNEFRPARPIEQELNNIINSDVYKALRPLPKGGNMHNHENHELSKETQLRLIYESDQFKYLYMVNGSSTKNPWTLDFFFNAPDDNDWIRVQDSGFTFEEILAQQTFMSILTSRATDYPSDTAERWRQMGVLWGRGSTQLIANVHIKKLYLEALYNQTMTEGAQYIETRKNFGAEEMLYEIDTTGNSNATNGKKYLDNREGELEVEMTKEIIADYQRRFPDFIGHRRIIYSSRYQRTYEDIKEDMERAVNLHEKFPDHIIGYDLVAEEDRGNSLLYYLDNFIDLYDNGTSKIPLYLHTAETNWPTDLISAPDSNEPLATVENIYDAILLSARRFGHGLGFIKHPYILNEIIARKSAIEVCPVSNQILGYVPDLRSHPGLIYHRQGVPIVLGSDDPGTFGYDSFSVDWYEIFMAWGLTLADLKKIAENSLYYSSMTATEIQNAIAVKWAPAWSRYIADMKETACNFNYESTIPEFTRIFPKRGARFASTDVSIFGRNFERAICKDIICMFGSTQSTRVTYITNNHIVCQSPTLTLSKDPAVRKLFFANQIHTGEFSSNDEITVNVTVDLGDGVKHDLGQFTYVYDTLEPLSRSSALSSTFLFISISSILSVFASWNY